MSLILMKRWTMYHMTHKVDAGPPQGMRRELDNPRSDVQERAKILEGNLHLPSDAGTQLRRLQHQGHVLEALESWASSSI